MFINYTMYIFIGQFWWKNSMYELFCVRRTTSDLTNVFIYHMCYMFTYIIYFNWLMTFFNPCRNVNVFIFFVHCFCYLLVYIYPMKHLYFRIFLSDINLVITNIKVSITLSSGVKATHFNIHKYLPESVPAIT